MRIFEKVRSIKMRAVILVMESIFIAHKILFGKEDEEKNEMKLEISLSETKEIAVVTFYGQIQQSTIFEFEKREADVLSWDRSSMILDCQEITEVDGYGLEALSRLVKKLQKRGRKLRLCLPTTETGEAIKDELAEMISINRYHRDLTAALHAARLGT